MEYDNQTGPDESGSADSPQLPTPVQIAQPEEDGSFFAEWFKVVDPNAPILEDQYFGRSGWALEPDNFADSQELDSYLKSDHVLAEHHKSAEEPTLLSLEGFASDEASDSESCENGLLGPVEMMPQMSDWSKMPPLLPPILADEAEEPILEVLDLEPQLSDWTNMPELKPLPLEASLSIPELNHKASTTSDYMFVESQVAEPQLQNEAVVPYYGQTVPAISYGAQASGHIGQYTGQMVPLYETPPVYHLPFIVLGSTQLSFV